MNSLDKNAEKWDELIESRQTRASEEHEAVKQDDNIA